MSLKKLKNRKWYDLGERHGLQNRIADIGLALDKCDTENLSVVDIGAAEGEFSLWLSHRFSEVHAIELMDDAFQKLQDNASEITNLSVYQADIFKESLDRTYNLVCFLGVLHYMRDDIRRENILRDVVGRASEVALVRTGFRELKILHDQDTHILNKYTSLISVLKVANDLDMRVILIDNFHRGKGKKKRLGSLVVFYRENASPWIEKFIGLLPTEGSYTESEIKKLIDL